MTETATRGIHHTIVKSAAKLDARFDREQDGGFYFIRISDERYRSLESFDTVGEAMEALRAKEVTFEIPKVEVSYGMCGKMAKSYHDAYSANPGGPGCNDGIDLAMREAFTVVPANYKDQHKRPSGQLNVEAMRQFGIDVGLWKDLWEHLNPGMQRMNLANRIRGYLRNNPDATITIAGETGRFGVKAKGEDPNQFANLSNALKNRKPATAAQEIARTAKRQAKKEAQAAA